MLRRQKLLRAQLHKLLDLCVFSLAFWLAHWARSVSGIEVLGGRAEIAPFSEYAWLLLFIAPFAPLILETQGVYERPLLASRMATAWQLMRACLLLAVGAVVLQFLVREQLARSVFIFFGGISFLLLMLKEELVRRWAQSTMGRDNLRRRLILAGEVEETTRLGKSLRFNYRDGFEVVETVRLNDTLLEELPALLDKHSANAVVLCARHAVFGLVEKTIHTCETEGVEVWLMADFFKTEISQASMDEFYGRPMLVFRSVPEATWQAVAKQIIDFSAAWLALLVLAPLMLACALIIKFTSPGPVFFRQKRSGLNGRPFEMLKFRSMVTNAEQLKQELASLNEMSGPVFKVTNDPRVTPFGRFMRKWSIDELPQLINILRGDMSLVGPRPLPVDEVKRFDERAHRRRLSVKPGLTCLWQISGRSELTDFREWVRLDLEYIDNWSIWLDLKIILRTIPVVMSGSGAK